MRGACCGDPSTSSLRLSPMAAPSLLGELWAFMRARKKLWLLPLVLVLLLVGMVIAFAQGSALAPFIYTIF